MNMNINRKKRISSQNDDSSFRSKSQDSFETKRKNDSF